MKVLIFGAGQVGQVFAEYLGAMTEPTFLVDAGYESTVLRTCPLFAAAKWFPPSKHCFMVGMSFKGLNVQRAAKFQAMSDLGYTPYSHIDYRAIMSKSANVGFGTMVMEQNVIQTAVRIGDNCVLWAGNHIGHNAKIGNHVWISSHVVVSGACEIGDFSFVGVNATIADGVKIGARCIIGAGSLVLRDVPDDSVVAEQGTPISKVRSDRAARLLG